MMMAASVMMAAPGMRAVKAFATFGGTPSGILIVMLRRMNQQYTIATKKAMMMPATIPWPPVQTSGTTMFTTSPDSAALAERGSTSTMAQSPHRAAGMAS